MSHVEMSCPECGYCATEAPENFVSERHCPKCQSYGFFIHPAPHADELTDSHEPTNHSPRKHLSDKTKFQLVCAALAAMLLGGIFYANSQYNSMKDEIASLRNQIQTEREDRKKHASALNSKYQEQYISALEEPILEERHKMLRGILSSARKEEIRPPVLGDITEALAKIIFVREKIIATKIEKAREETEIKAQDSKAALEEQTSKLEELMHQNRLHEKTLQTQNAKLDKRVEELSKQRKELAVLMAKARVSMRKSEEALKLAVKREKLATSQEASARKREQEANIAKAKLQARRDNASTSSARKTQPNVIYVPTVTNSTTYYRNSSEDFYDLFKYTYGSGRHLYYKPNYHYYNKSKYHNVNPHAYKQYKKPYLIKKNGVAIIIK